MKNEETQNPLRQPRHPETLLSISRRSRTTLNTPSPKTLGGPVAFLVHTDRICWRQVLWRNLALHWWRFQHLRDSRCLWQLLFSAQTIRTGTRFLALHVRQPLHGTYLLTTWKTAPANGLAPRRPCRL